MPDHVVDATAMRDLLAGPQGPVVRAVTDIVRQGTNLAKIECPVDTGRLRASHQFTVGTGARPTEIVGRFGSNVEYAETVHNGSVVTSTSRVGRSRVTTTRRRAGNPWLLRAARRAGINVTR